MGITDRIKPNFDVMAFFITTIIFTWFFWILALLIQNFGFISLAPYSLFVTIGTFVPSAAGFVFAYLFGGQVEMRLLLKLMLDIHIKLKWLFLIFLLLPGVSAISCLIFKFLGNTLPKTQFKPWVVPAVFIYILIFMGPLGEEAGWRGFALNRLLRQTSPLKAALLLGVVWSFWHLPLFFINGTTQNALTEFGFLPAIAGFILYTIIMSVLLTLFYIMNNGSLFASIMFHTMGNFSLGFMPLVFFKTGAIIILSVLSVVATLFVYRYRKNMFCKV